jgi:hypothetical protein
MAREVVARCESCGREFLSLGDYHKVALAKGQPMRDRYPRGDRAFCNGEIQLTELGRAKYVATTV